MSNLRQDCPYQKVVSGFFNYPLYEPLYEGFSHTTASLAGIPGVNQALVTYNCSDPSILGTFFENHDLTRFWNQTSDVTLGKNAATYLIFSQGIPFVYAGFETMQAGSYPNYNRDPVWPSGWKETEMHTFLGILNKFRNGVINKDGDAFLKGGMKFLYSAGNVLVFKRGDIIVFTTNVGSNGAPVTVTTADIGFASGTTMIDGLSNSTVTVGNGGIMRVTLTHGMPMVFYPQNEYNSVVLSTKLTTIQNNSTSLSPNTTTSAGNTTASSSAKSSAGKMHVQKTHFGIMMMAVCVALGLRPGVL
jgi:alpha-amylase